MSTSQKIEKQLSYKQQLIASINSLDKEITRRSQNLFIQSPDFNAKVSEINSLRVTLKAKKQRLFFLDKPKPYMIDTSNQAIISSYKYK